jgi:hypothetical protein
LAPQPDQLNVTDTALIFPPMQTVARIGFDETPIAIVDFDTTPWAVRSAGVWIRPQSINVLFGKLRLVYSVGLAPPVDAVRYQGQPGTVVAPSGATVWKFQAPIPFP